MRVPCDDHSEHKSLLDSIKRSSKSRGDLPFTKNVITRPILTFTTPPVRESDRDKCAGQEQKEFRAQLILKKVQLFLHLVHHDVLQHLQGLRALQLRRRHSKGCFGSFCRSDELPRAHLKWATRQRSSRVGLWTMAGILLLEELLHRVQGNDSL